MVAEASMRRWPLAAEAAKALAERRRPQARKTLFEEAAAAQYVKRAAVFLRHVG